MHLIGLAGPAGAGKDTVADMLVESFGWRKFSFSDELYKEVSTAFDVSIEFLQNRETKETPMDEMALPQCKDRDFETIMQCGIPPYDWADIRHDAMSPRVILQRWGTAYRRAQDPDYWVNHAKAAYAQGVRDGVPGMVNTSCRFPNEAAWIRSMGKVVHVIRPEFEPVNAHVAEQPLPIGWMDLTVHNRLGLAHLAHEVIALHDWVTNPLISGAGM